MAAARQVGVPGGVMIWGDVEGAWTPTAEWFRGWWDGMSKSGYAGWGGIYCRPNAKQFYEPYTKAVLQSLGMDPKASAAKPTVANGALATRGTSILLNPFATKPADRVITVIPPDSADKLRLLWGTQPQKSHWSNPATDIFEFKPHEPPALPGRVALWQYHCDFLKAHAGDHYGLVDLDLADDRAYARMWQP